MTFPLWFLWTMIFLCPVLVVALGVLVMWLWIWFEEWVYRRRWSGPVKKHDEQRWL